MPHFAYSHHAEAVDVEEANSATESEQAKILQNRIVVYASAEFARTEG